MVIAIVGAVAAAATIGSAAISSSSASNQADAAKSASGTQARSADRAAQLQYRSEQEGRAQQLQMYNQNRADQRPYREAGQYGLRKIRGGLEQGGQFQKPFQFEEDPGYQFRLAEGMKALDRSAASRGMLLSGAQVQGATRFNQGMASDEYGAAFNRFQVDRTNRFNRLASLAQLGQTSVGQTGAAGTSTGQSIAALGQASAAAQGEFGVQAGNARASGYIGAANAQAQGMQGIGNAVQGGLSSFLTLSQLNRPSAYSAPSANWGGVNPYQTSIASPYS